jgi:hypothetical protein
MDFTSERSDSKSFLMVLVVTLLGLMQVSKSHLSENLCILVVNSEMSMKEIDNYTNLCFLKGKNLKNQV